MSTYALITGASKGIGKQIAIALAKRNYNLLLVARSAAALTTLKDELITGYGVTVEILAIDLSAPHAAEDVFNWCTENEFPISVLINNAGYGLFGKFENLALHDQLNMLQLNIDTVVDLTYRLLPILKKNPHSYILNVSSTAAYQALPGFAAYAASKAFILSFSRALRYELKNDHVVVTCLSPGPADTGFAERAGISAFSKFAKKFNMPPDTVAETAVKALFANQSEVIPGLTNKFSAFASRLLSKAFIEKTAASLYDI
ncbi:MAG: SDR family NAD(P)-dependent oxidoreductase [Sphingobacteriaceae bacterium]